MGSSHTNLRCTGSDLQSIWVSTAYSEWHFPGVLLGDGLSYVCPRENAALEMPGAESGTPCTPSMHSATEPCSLLHKASPAFLLTGAVGEARLWRLSCCDGRELCHCLNDPVLPLIVRMLKHRHNVLLHSAPEWYSISLDYSCDSLY